MGKKYLYVPYWSSTYSEKDGLAEKVAKEFERKAFMTDSTLFMLIDFNRIVLLRYWKNFMGLTGASCKIQFLIKGANPIEQIFDNIDCYISGDNPDEFTFLDYAYRKGVKIISASQYLSNEQAVDTEPVSAEIQAIRQNCDNLKNSIIDTYPPQQWEYFLFHTGLGDSLVFSYWLKEYKRYNNKKSGNKKILLLCIHKTRAELMSLCPYVDSILIVPPQFFDYMEIYYAEQYKIRNVHVAYYLPPALGKIINFEYRSTIIGVFKDFLNINVKAKFERYPINLPENSRVTAQNLFRDMQLIEGKTVFIVPEGVTWGNFLKQSDFWIRMFEKIKSKGFEVVTNSVEEIIPGCRHVFLPLAESVTFIGLCGNIISVPTGFSEVACALNENVKIQFHAIYPNPKNDFWHRSYMAWNLFRLADLQHFGGNFVQHYMQEYTYFLSQVSSPSVTAMAYQLGDTPAENDRLIEKIVNKITETK